MKVYGIANCDTVRKARKFLESAGLDYEFHDYKKAGVDREKLAALVSQFGWDVILNTKGTTWRKLDDDTKASVVNAETALAVMLEHPSAIKRPIVDAAGKTLIGFDPISWELALELGELR